MARTQAAAPQRLDAFQKAQETRVTLAGVLASSFLQSAASIDDAKLGLASAAEGQLAIIRKAVEGMEPITAQEWDNDVAGPLKEQLKASGRYAIDAKGNAAGVNPVASNLKVVVVALTHGSTLGVAKTLAAAATVAREFNAKAGLIAPTAKGAPKKTAAAPNAGVTGNAAPKPDREEPAALTYGDLASMTAAAMCLCDGDEKMAELLVAICATEQGLDRLAPVVAEMAQPSPGRKSRIG